MYNLGNDVEERRKRYAQRMKERGQVTETEKTEMTENSDSSESSDSDPNGSFTKSKSKSGRFGGKNKMSQNQIIKDMIKKEKAEKRLIRQKIKDYENNIKIENAAKDDAYTRANSKVLTEEEKLARMNLPDRVRYQIEAKYAKMLELDKISEKESSYYNKSAYLRANKFNKLSSNNVYGGNNNGKKTAKRSNARTKSRIEKGQNVLGSRHNMSKSSKATESFSNSDSYGSRMTPNQSQNQFSNNMNLNTFQTLNTETDNQSEYQSDALKTVNLSNDKRSNSQPYRRRKNRSNTQEPIPKSLQKMKNYKPKKAQKRQFSGANPLKLDKIFEVNDDSKSDYFRSYDIDQKMGPIRRKSKEFIKHYERKNSKDNLNSNYSNFATPKNGKFRAFGMVDKSQKSRIIAPSVEGKYNKRQQRDKQQALFAKYKGVSLQSEKERQAKLDRMRNQKVKNVIQWANHSKYELDEEDLLDPYEYSALKKLKGLNAFRSKKNKKQNGVNGMDENNGVKIKKKINFRDVVMMVRQANDGYEEPK